jgi:hypothetical protein
VFETLFAGDPFPTRALHFELREGSEMADIDRLSERLVDLAERFADVTDAAQGRGNRQGGIRARWFVLPAAAAGVYFLGASGSLRRQAGNVAKQAKDRATELPDDLMGRVHKATRRTTTSAARSNGRSRSRSTRRTQSRRRRSTQTSAAR